MRYSYERWGKFLKKIEMTHFTLMCDGVKRFSTNLYEGTHMIVGLRFKVSLFDVEFAKV